MGVVYPIPGGEVSMTDLITSLEGATDEETMDTLAALHLQSTGVSENNVNITVNGGDTAKVDISAVNGYITVGFGNAETTTKINYEGVVGVTPTYQATLFYIDTSNQLVQRDNLLGKTGVDTETMMFIGGTATIGGVVAAIQISPRIAKPSARRFADFSDCLGSINCNGNIVTPNGANLLFDKSAGKTFRVDSNFSNDTSNPDITQDALIQNPQGFNVIIVGFQTSTPGVFQYEAYSNLLPDNWDDGSGTKATVANNKWSIRRLYFFNATQTFGLYLGQAEYSSYDNAVAGITSEGAARDPATEPALLICCIVVKKGATDLAADVASGIALFKASDKFGNP